MCTKQVAHECIRSTVHHTPMQTPSTTLLAGTVLAGTSWLAKQLAQVRRTGRRSTSRSEGSPVLSATSRCDRLLPEACGCPRTGPPSMMCRTTLRLRALTTLTDGRSPALAWLSTNGTVTRRTAAISSTVLNASGFSNPSTPCLVARAPVLSCARGPRGRFLRARHDRLSWSPDLAGQHWAP